MRNDGVLIPVLHVAHDTKCISPCVYSHFIDNYPTTLFYHKKCQRLGCMSTKKRGRTVGSIENGASLRLIHNLSKSLTCFERAESLHHNLSVIFHFCTRITRKHRQKLSTTYAIKCPVLSTIL